MRAVLSLRSRRRWATRLLLAGLALLWVSQSAIAQPSNLAQLASPQSVLDASTNLFGESNQPVSRWIRLDGKRLFQVTALKDNLPERVQQIQQNLRQVSQAYFAADNPDLEVEIQEENGLPVISVNDQNVLTVTDLDARLRSVDPMTRAEQLQDTLQEALVRGRQERQTTFLVRQGKIAATILVIMLLVSWTLWRQQRRLRAPLVVDDESVTHPLGSHRIHLHRESLQEVKRRLFQLAQTGVWLGGVLVSLSLFPYTRPLQAWSLAILGIPLILAVAGVGTYLVIRLTYALVDRFTAAIAVSPLVNPVASERLQLRLGTIARVSKGVATVVWVGVGIVVALLALNVDVGPLLAGAGLIGVAVSLASQNVIKDAINGFLIILEDQYGVGDFIKTGEWSGMVEAMNLRVTRLRNSEGQLITIPNSEIKAVANLSSTWSRVDLNVPVAYNTDLDQAIKLVDGVAQEMSQDPQWQDVILEPPRLMGVDEFGDRGLMVKVWIKTQPLQQWNVAREYRRRIKLAFDQAGIVIPIPQQALWMNDYPAFASHEPPRHQGESSNRPL